MLEYFLSPAKADRPADRRGVVRPLRPPLVTGLIWTLQDWTMTDRFVKPAQLLIVGLCSEIDETGGPDRATHLWNALMVTVGLLKRSRQELDSRAKKK